MVFANSEHPTLPRLHQEHSDSASGASGSGGVSFIGTMPPLARVVATSKIGREAGIGGMATTDFSPTVST